MTPHLAVPSGAALARACAALVAGVALAAHCEAATFDATDGAAAAAVATHTEQIASTAGGGTWSLIDGHLAFAAANGGDAVVVLADSGYGSFSRFAVDPFDDSIWVTSEAGMLLHFTTSGVLLAGTSLPGPVDALQVALDQTTWLLVGTELIHATHSAYLAERLLLSDLVSDHPTGFVVDSLRDRIWVLGERGLWRVGMRDPIVPDVAAMIAEPRAIALDGRSGDVWVLSRDELIVIDEDAIERLHAPLPDDAREAATLEYEPDHRQAVLRTSSRLLRIARDGVSESQPLPLTADLVTAAPFRLTPAITLLRPPAGGVVVTQLPQLELQVGALCNGTPCALPDRYANGIEAIVDIDGTAGSVRVEAKTGQVTAGPVEPLSPGEHVVGARVRDRFGHEAAMAATITVLERTASTGMGAPGIPVVGREGTEALKAANKAPAVVMTAPTSGATYSTGTSILLAAAASDPDGSITKVEFYRNASTLIGSVTSPPYQFAWQGASAGSYSISAKAYDNRNATATSAAVAIAVVANQPPVVALSSPASGAFVGEGDPVSIAAAASDADGAIAKVEFLDGATPIGAATMPPYSMTWNAARPGTHTITARATDDKNGVTVSSPIDIAVGALPIVVVKFPLACSIVDDTGALTLAADAMSATGVVTQVEFFDNGVLVGIATAEPWRATLALPAAGNHAISARASDDRGLARTSRSATLTVRASNQPPTVSMASPADGTRVPLGTRLNLSASADDADGTVSTVEYRLDTGAGSLIARSTSAPFAATWTPSSAGTYALIAVAIDDRGAQASSTPVHVTVDPNLPPSVSLTSPVADARYTAPATVSLGASASDGDGAIAKVEFLANGTVVGVATSAPYTATWSGVPAGTYNVTARATDDRASTTVSAPVAIVVVSNEPPTIALRPPGGEPYFAPAAIVLVADASDPDGSISRIEFRANGTLLGTSFAPPYAFAWDRVPTGTYVITATAFDDRDGMTTSAPLALTIGGSLDVSLAQGLDGATIADDNVLIRGTVSAPANSAMTVNGIVAHIDDDGRFQVNDVKLDPGTNAVTAVVTTQDGQTSSQTISLTSSGPGAFIVRAAPTEGLDRLTVVFTVENPDDVSFARMTFDLDGNGTADISVTPGQFSDGTLSISATYPVGTWVAVATAYDDQEHIIYSTKKSIVVSSPAVLQTKLKGIYDVMLMRLRAGNVQSAVTAFTGSSRDRYSALLTELQQDLPTIVDQLGTLVEFTFAMDLAELKVVRATPDGPRQFLLYMLRSEDGIWRFDGM